MLALSGLSVFFLYTWVSFILAPLAGDIKIFLASAKQASYLSPSLIVGSIKVWELKSVLSRMLAYFLYKIAVGKVSVYLILFRRKQLRPFELFCHFLTFFF